MTTASMDNNNNANIFKVLKAGNCMDQIPSGGRLGLADYLTLVEMCCVYWRQTTDMLFLATLQVSWIKASIPREQFPMPETRDSLVASSFLRVCYDKSAPVEFRLKGQWL